MLQRRDHGQQDHLNKGALGANKPASPATGTAAFELEGPLEDLYDRLEGISDPFEDDGTDRAAVKALLDEVWAKSKAKNREAPEPQSARTLASALSKRIRVGG